MAKYHVNQETGRYGVCEAQPGNCPVAGEENHFDNKDTAVKASESRLAEIHGGTITAMKKEAKFHKKGTDPFHKEKMQSGVHFDTKEEAANAQPNISLDYLNKSVRNEELGGLPLKTEEFNSAMDSVVSEGVDRMADDVYNDLLMDAPEVSPGSWNEPPEHMEAELNIDEDGYKYITKNSSQRFLKENPGVLDEAFAAGYPFTKDREEASKIIANDVIVILDGDDALGDEAFQSLEKNLGEEKAKEIYSKIESKAYPENGFYKGNDRYNLSLHPFVEEGKSTKYSTEFQFGPDPLELKRIRSLDKD